jgi:hypothetical protein
MRSGYAGSRGLVADMVRTILFRRGGSGRLVSTLHGQRNKENRTKNGKIKRRKEKSSIDQAKKTTAARGNGVEVGTLVHGGPRRQGNGG